MIDAARHPGIAGPFPIGAEIGIDIVLALGRLHEDEMRAAGARAVEIDILLVPRHIDPLDRHAPGAVDLGMGPVVAGNGIVEPTHAAAGGKRHHGQAQNGATKKGGDGAGKQRGHDRRHSVRKTKPDL